MEFPVMQALAALSAGIAALIVTALLMRPLVAALRRRAVMDIPNERSSHTVPTPRGGGLAVTTVMVVGWAIAIAMLGDGPYLGMAGVVLAGAALLGGLSWIDDRVNLPRRLRFPVHVLVVVAALAALPADALVFQGVLPTWGDRLVSALAWVWFVNLYNFMDGIDGITGAETASLGLGVTGLALGLGVGVASGLPVAMLGMITAGAAGGFLLWNWHPAKVFLGDVGSIPLGYLLGWLLVILALSGFLAVAFILPAFYLADASLTLAARAGRGVSIIAAHREHFYQRAVHVGGLRHDQVVIRVLVGNGVLAAAAWVAAAGAPGIGAAIAVGM
ncbi:MAG: glycosyltransferase family 4 protein, partial [Rhodospirillaceae bacterium]